MTNAIGHDTDAGGFVRVRWYGLLTVPGLTRVQLTGKVVAVIDPDDRFDEPVRDDTGGMAAPGGRGSG